MQTTIANATNLRVAESTVKNVFSHTLCSCMSMLHCSRVTDMAVRSLALLQLVTRSPFRRRATCGARGRFELK